MRTKLWLRIADNLLSKLLLLSLQHSSWHIPVFITEGINNSRAIAVLLLLLKLLCVIIICHVLVKWCIHDVSIVFSLLELGTRVVALIIYVVSLKLFRIQSSCEFSSVLSHVCKVRSVSLGHVLRKHIWYFVSEVIEELGDVLWLLELQFLHFLLEVQFLLLQLLFKLVFLHLNAGELVLIILRHLIHILLKVSMLLLMKFMLFL